MKGCRKMSTDNRVPSSPPTKPVHCCLPSCRQVCACGGRYVGQINTTDFFTRLLCGIAYTGLAPESFYTPANGTRPHFDGTPVDVVSGVITATLAYERLGFATYHVVNPHYTDGISLDTIAAWLASAGVKVGILTAPSHSAVVLRWTCGGALQRDSMHPLRETGDTGLGDSHLCLAR